MALETAERDGLAPREGTGAAGVTDRALIDDGHAKQWSNRKLRMLLCCAGAPFLIMLDTNIVAVSLPAIARDFAERLLMSNGLSARTSFLFAHF